MSEFEPINIKQTRGETIETTAMLLGETEFSMRGRVPRQARLEVWQTRGGALVAVSEFRPETEGGFDDVRAVVVEPRDDAQEMRFEVMRFFEWDNRARSMARDMGWDLTRRVE